MSSSGSRTAGPASTGDRDGPPRTAARCSGSEHLYRAWTFGQVGSLAVAGRARRGTCQLRGYPLRYGVRGPKQTKRQVLERRSNLGNHDMTVYPDFLHDKRITGPMAKTYMALLSFDHGSGVWVAIETIARKLGVSESTIHRAVRQLKSAGVLEVKEQFEGESQLTNFYLFPTPNWWSEEARQGVLEMTPKSGTQVSNYSLTTTTTTNKISSNTLISSKPVVPRQISGADTPSGEGSERLRPSPEVPGVEASPAQTRITRPWKPMPRK
ncbi:hypothetical protein C6A85_000000108545, partial [Mycobacterium sp. ITM-2017-0098]